MANFLGGLIYGLSKRMLHRIRPLMHNTRCRGRCGLTTNGEQKDRWQLSASEWWAKITDGKWVHQNESSENEEGIWLLGHRWDRWVWRITLESFSNCLYIYSKNILVQQRMYLGLKGKWECNGQKNLSQNKPAEIDEFIYVQPNGVIMRKTLISIIKYGIRENQIGAI